MTSSSDDAVDQRPTDYPFTEWQLKLQAAILRLKGRPRHCATHAFKGLKRAWKIAEIDPEMAYFRAITAEEEAATALIFALKHRKYPGADKLDYSHHPHKAGITPFLRAIENTFSELKLPPPQYRLVFNSEPPGIYIQFLSENLGLPPGYILEPDHPLNGFLGLEGDSQKSRAIFTGALENYAKNKGKASVLRVIHEEANIRNKLLYAADNGIPHVQNVDSVLLAKSRPISIIISLTIAILQTREHQLLVLQALEAYLHIFNRAPENPLDYKSSSYSDAVFQIEISRNGGSSPIASFWRTYRYNHDYNFTLRHPLEGAFQIETPSSQA